MKNKKSIDILNREKLKIALESGQMGTWEWDIKKKKIKWSEILEKIHGIEKGSFSGRFKDYLKDIHPEDKAKVISRINKILGKGKKYSVQYRIVRPDGQIRWLDAKGQVLRDEEGRPSKMIGICLDITSTKDLQERFKALYLISKEIWKANSLKQISKKILKVISETFKFQMGALWLLDEDKNAMLLELIWPEKEWSFSGYERKLKSFNFKRGQGLVGNTWKRGKIIWLSEIDKAKLPERYSLFRKIGIKAIISFPIKASGKVIGVLEFYSTNRRKKDKVTISIIETLKNNLGQMVEKQRIREEIELNRKQLVTIFKSVPFGITVESKKGEILYANEAFVQIFGLGSINDLIGINIKDIFIKYKVFDDDGVEYKLNRMPAAKIFSGEDDIQEKLLFINKKSRNEMWLTVRAIAVKGVGKETQVVIKSFKDITTTIEEQRQREFFLGVVGHELKSPLASIKAYAQLLKRRMESRQENMLDYVNNIDSQVDRLTKLINDIFDITKLSSGNLELNKRKFNLDKTVDRVIKNFELVANGHTLKRIGKVNENVYADEDRIVQVLMNLFSNAIEHSHKGKTVKIISGSNGKFATVSVVDRGVGIPKKYHNKIFRLYNVIPGNAPSKKNSLGIGLSISQAFIKAHGGRIELKSELGKGAEFTIFLPIREE